jgi:hypothetical protein
MLKKSARYRGPSKCGAYRQKNEKTTILKPTHSVEVLKSLGACVAIPYCISYANVHKICSLELICIVEAVKKYAISG